MADSTSQIVIISNRLPVSRKKAGRSHVWKTSPGGLVSALRPILRERPSTWVGWAGFPGEAPAPFQHDEICNYPISLSRTEVRSFYEGFANRTLWPLYHDAVRPPEFRRRWWWTYLEVNQRFARAAADIAAPGGLVWVHDYHLQLVPQMLRELRPDLRIGFFLHIPFPPRELFVQLPWRKQILRGLLGADVVGFQTRVGSQNFAQLCSRLGVARGRRDELQFEGRTIRVGAYPISIDVESFESLARSEAVQKQARRLRARLGQNRKIIVGVDRLDYTKGIDIRLRAFHELLKIDRFRADKCAFVQVAVPSRERVEEYRELRSLVERTVGEINGEYAELGQSVVNYLHRSLGPEELVALYLAADVMLVTPLRDGMNLVAKEYVASRIDERGALILSEFTGSAIELQSALLVNPHDLDGLIETIGIALELPEREQARRMRAMRRALHRNDVFHWANSFLTALRGNA